MKKLALVLGFCVIFSIYPLRELYLTGYPNILPGNYRLAFFNQDGSPISVAIPNMLFMLGYPRLVTKANHIRPHWFVLWTLYGLAIWRKGVRRGFIIHLYLATNIGVMLGNVYLASYGFRYMLPIIFVPGLVIGGGVSNENQQS